MGMGYAAASANVVSVEEIRKLKLSSFQELESYVEENDVSLFTVYMNVVFGQDEPGTTKKEKHVAKLYNDFIKDFKKQTGVEIRINYHDREERGSRYDDVEGYFFILNDSDLYIPTKENVRLREKINFEYERWVEFG